MVQNERNLPFGKEQWLVIGEKLLQEVNHPYVHRDMLVHTCLVLQELHLIVHVVPNYESQEEVGLMQ